ncbi:MAG: hypothetical protein OXK79_05520 [Chloroflexota bacterium]|nr:hypothetical protein [Chloroflexota bacterium]
MQQSIGFMQVSELEELGADAVKIEFSQRLPALTENEDANAADHLIVAPKQSAHEDPGISRRSIAPSQEKVAKRLDGAALGSRIAVATVFGNGSMMRIGVLGTVTRAKNLADARGEKPSGDNSDGILVAKR